MVSVMEKRLMPAGYKQTEVGVIPEDWEIFEIQDIARIGSGTTPARIQEDRYFKNGVSCWVKTLDLNNSVVRVTEEKVTDLALKETSLQVYPKGTVLVAMYGGFNQIGRTGILEIPASVNQAVVAIQVLRSYNSRYLLDMLNYRVEYWKLVASSSRKDPNITSIDVKQFKLALPPTKDEQTAIASALSDVDALIAVLEKLINKKSAIKTAAMQQLLTGKKRLPPFDQLNTGYKQSELGGIPGDWDVVELGALGQFKNGINKDADSFGYGTPFVNLMDVFGKPSINEIKELGLIDATENDLKEYDLKSGDVLFIRSSVKPSGVGLTSVVKKNLDRTVYSGFLIRFRSNEKLETVFKEHCFYQSDFRKRIIAASSVSANTNINQDNLRKIALVVPPLVEQTAIANVLSDMDKELEVLQQRLHKTQQIKQGMMQELLTGKTRLVKPQGAPNA